MSHTTRNVFCVITDMCCIQHKLCLYSYWHVRRNSFLLRHWHLTSTCPLLTHWRCELFYFSFFPNGRFSSSTKNQQAASPWQKKTSTIRRKQYQALFTVRLTSLRDSHFRPQFDSSPVPRTVKGCTATVYIQTTEGCRAIRQPTHLPQAVSSLSMIPPPVPHQSSTHFVHTTVGTNNHVIIFGYEKCFMLVNIGQKGMDGNRTWYWAWEAPSAIFFAIHGISFSGFSTVTSPILL
jgi:hypothetical protein